MSERSPAAFYQLLMLNAVDDAVRKDSFARLSRELAAQAKHDADTIADLVKALKDARHCILSGDDTVRSLNAIDAALARVRRQP